MKSYRIVLINTCNAGFYERYTSEIIIMHLNFTMINIIGIDNKLQPYDRLVYDLIATYTFFSKLF